MNPTILFTVAHENMLLRLIFFHQMFSIIFLVCIRRTKSFVEPSIFWTGRSSGSSFVNFFVGEVAWWSIVANVSSHVSLLRGNSKENSQSEERHLRKDSRENDSDELSELPCCLLVCKSRRHSQPSSSCPIQVGCSVRWLQLSRVCKGVKYSKLNIVSHRVP